MKLKNDANAKAGRGALPAEATYISSDERRAQGRALREVARRSSHAGWNPPADRRNAIDILAESNEGRLPDMVPIRFGRMSASPFAFYRGAAAVMAADLAKTPASGIRVLACGDAHLMNFGGFATPERNIVFDVNDLDETLPAPWEWDLKRLAASLVVAGQHLGFRDSDGADGTASLARHYREKMGEYATMRALDVWYDKIDLQQYEDRAASPDLQVRIRKYVAKRIEAQRRKERPDYMLPKLVTLTGGKPRIKDEPPLIFHPSKQLAPGLATGFAEAGSAYLESLPEHVRTLLNRYHWFDFVVKVVGVGSVGTVCAVALFMADDDDPLFLQFKEARASVLEPYAGRSVHRNHGQRVVIGQRLMQAASDVFLGWTRGKNGRHMYVRQLRDMKISPIIEDMDATQLRLFGHLCAHALARAHARSGDAAMITGYLGAGRAFDNAISKFAVDYSHQNRSDYESFLDAIGNGSISAINEE